MAVALTFALCSCATTNGGMNGGELLADGNVGGGRNSASPAAPGNYFKDAEQAISIPAPVELERKGITAVTAVIGVLNPVLYPEYPAAVVQSQQFGGVWPTTARRPGGSVVQGDKFFFTEGPLNSHLTISLFPAALSEGDQIVSFSRDGNLAFTDLAQPIQQYDQKSFKKKEDHRRTVYSASLTVGQIESAWQGFMEQSGQEATSFVRVMPIPSREWDEFKGMLKEIFPYDYQMGNGEIRWGYIPIGKYKEEAVKNHRTTAGKRFLKEFRPNLIFTDPISFAVDNGSRLLTSGIAAGVDKSWTGPYLKAEGEKKELSGHFELLQATFARELEKRERALAEQQGRIRELEEKLQQRETSPAKRKK